MSEKVFEPMEVIRFGWNTLKSNIKFFVVLMIIVGVLYNIPQLISMALLPLALPSPDSFSPTSLYIIIFLIAIISMLIYIIVELGLLKIALNLRDGLTPQIEDLFSRYQLLPKYLAASIAYGLMVMIGLLLFIIPGIYLALKYQFYGYLIVDRGLGPIEALKGSGKMKQGQKTNLLVFWLVLYCGIFVILLFLAIFIALPVGIFLAFISERLAAWFGIAANLIWSIIGLIVIIPIIKLATADIYRILEKHSLALEAKVSSNLDDSIGSES